MPAWTAANGGPRPARPPARREFERAIELRETLHRLFDAEAQDKTPAARDLAALNEALAAAPNRTALRRERGAYGWDIDVKSGTALALLAPVLWSAGDLLAGPRLDRVRRCANPECGWLFLDDSRAGKRRWCSMSVLRQPRQGAAPLSPQSRTVNRRAIVRKWLRAISLLTSCKRSSSTSIKEQVSPGR